MEKYFTINKGKAIFLIERGYKLLEIQKNGKGKLQYIFEKTIEMKKDIDNYNEANSILTIKIKDFFK